MKFQTMIRINGVATILSPWITGIRDEDPHTVIIENLRAAIRSYTERRNNTIPPSDSPDPQVFHIEIAIGRQP